MRTRRLPSAIRAAMLSGAAIATIALVAPTASAKPANAGGGSAPVSVTTSNVYVEVHSTGDEGSMSEADCNALGAAINSLDTQAGSWEVAGNQTGGVTASDARATAQVLRQASEAAQDKATSSGCFVIY